MLVKFSSVLDAVRCAANVQSRMTDRNAGSARSRVGQGSALNNGPAGKLAGPFPAPSAFRMIAMARPRRRIAFTPCQLFAATMPAMRNPADKVGLPAALVILVVGTIVAIAFGAMLAAVVLHI
jgi:hypothetical protein